MLSLIKRKFITPSYLYFTRIEKKFNPHFLTYTPKIILRIADHTSEGKQQQFVTLRVLGQILFQKSFIEMDWKKVLYI